jgi:hypothetical protein
MGSDAAVDFFHGKQDELSQSVVTAFVGAVAKENVVQRNERSYSRNWTYRAQGMICGAIMDFVVLAVCTRAKRWRSVMWHQAYKQDHLCHREGKYVVVGRSTSQTRKSNTPPWGYRKPHHYFLRVQPKWDYVSSFRQITRINIMETLSTEEETISTRQLGKAEEDSGC